jgi:hypothetical protein
MEAADREVVESLFLAQDLPVGVGPGGASREDIPY